MRFAIPTELVESYSAAGTAVGMRVSAFGSDQSKRTQQIGVAISTRLAKRIEATVVRSGLALSYFIWSLIRAVRKTGTEKLPITFRGTSLHTSWSSLICTRILACCLFLLYLRTSDSLTSPARTLHPSSPVLRKVLFTSKQKVSCVLAFRRPACKRVFGCVDHSEGSRCSKVVLVLPT